MRSILNTVLVTLGLLVTNVSFASTADWNQKYLTIKDIKIESTPLQQVSHLMVTRSDDSFGLDLNEIEKTLDQVINIGQKVWSVIEAGRPAVNVQSARAMAMPYGVQNWMDLQNWQTPVAKSYLVTITNALGMEVVKFGYAVNYIYGGNVNGKGAYIGYAQVIPTVISVAYGYTLNVNAEVPVVMNRGTKQAPIAGMQLNLNWKVSTVVKELQERKLYSIDGRGHFQALN